MSGIVVLFHPSGAPVDLGLLRRMTAALSYRGPDRHEARSLGRVGLGHAMLETTPESKGARQPTTLEGQVWITADARVDGRAELVRELGSKGRRDLRQATDAQLILHAYHCWGRACVEHLIGDFAFAIWDAGRQRLFCARDRFGVKPLYWCHRGETLLVASDVDSLRIHPRVSAELDEVAIGDFLIFGESQDPGRVEYRDVQRLPAAHRLSADSAGVRRDEYWTLPLDGHLRLAGDAEYVERFGELFRTAVADRLRTDRAAVVMSGGTDSTAVGVVAARHMKRTFPRAEPKALTIVYEELLTDDEEGRYARLAADAVDMPLELLVADRYGLFERAEELASWHQLPRLEPSLAMWADYWARCAAHGRVALTGLGGDPAMAYPQSYYLGLLSRGRPVEFLRETARHLRRYRTPEGLGLRSAMQRLFGRSPDWTPPFPAWIRPEFERRVDLRERWQHFSKPGALEHPSHGEAHRALKMSWWPMMFELDYNPPVALEVRHPFFDIRLIEFLLAIPPIPWCRHKTILREAMRDVLPEPVRERPKAALSRDPTVARLERGEPRDRVDTSLELVAEWVDPRLYRRELESASVKGALDWAGRALPVSLDIWVRSHEK